MKRPSVPGATPNKEPAGGVIGTDHLWCLRAPNRGTRLVSPYPMSHLWGYGDRGRLRSCFEQGVTCGKCSPTSRCMSLSVSGQQAESCVAMPGGPFKALGCATRLILYLELQNVKSDSQQWQGGDRLASTLSALFTGLKIETEFVCVCVCVHPCTHAHTCIKAQGAGLEH